DPHLERERIGEEHRRGNAEEPEVAGTVTRPPGEDGQRWHQRDPLCAREEREPCRDRGPAEAATLGEEERRDREREEERLAVHGPEEKRRREERHVEHGPS